MNLIETLNNTEKDLSSGEYCVAFDLMANTRTSVSKDEIKSKYRLREKRIEFILSKLIGITFLIQIIFLISKLFDKVS